MSDDTITRKEITKPHSIITARMTLTAKEQDLLSLLIMKIKDLADSSKVIEGQFDVNGLVDLDEIKTIYEFGVEELSETLGITAKTLARVSKCPDTGVIQPSPLERACQAIRNQDVKIRTEAGDFIGRRLVSDATYNSQEKVLTLETTRTMAAIMLDYGVKNNNFGKTDMKLFFSLQGPIEKRVLELISRFKNLRDFKISLGEFCEILNIYPDNYSSMSNFRKNVLEKPLQRIVKASKGMWTTKSGYPKGYYLKRGAKPNDMISFKMTYTPTHQEVLTALNGIEVELTKFNGLETQLPLFGGVVDYAFLNVKVAIIISREGMTEEEIEAEFELKMEAQLQGWFMLSYDEKADPSKINGDLTRIFKRHGKL